jgi:glycerol-3-phosphate acyltransferase PlsY
VNAELAAFGTAALSALCGSIPFGLLLTRAAGLGDIRAIGSGNIGATNVLRTGRRGLAAATLVLDAAKGAAPVQAAAVLFGSQFMPLAAIVAVVAHCYTPWLGFRGGKGVATGLGVLLALDVRVGGVACAAWLVGALLSRRSSVGALAAFAAAPVAAWYFLPALWWGAPTIIAAVIYWRHRANIARLADGSEPRIGAAEKKEGGGSAPRPRRAGPGPIT